RMDDFSALQVESEKNRLEFLRTEVSVCCTLIELATTEHQLGHQEAAERSIRHAEEGHATLIRFLSDQMHAQHLTRKELEELTDGACEIRRRLDALQASWLFNSVSL